MSTFFLDYEAGSDTARTALTTVTVANPSGSITRATKTAHGLVDGAVVDATAFTAWLNTRWEITVVDANNFDLVGAVWQATADSNGTMTPRGGSSKADAWKTLTSGATAARIQPGDTIRIMASREPDYMNPGGYWTNGPLQSTTAITSSTNATPIVVTRVAHGLTTDDTVIINAHTTNTKANGAWKANVLTADTFSLLHEDGTNSVGNGVGGASGTFRQVNCLVVRLANAVTANVACFGNQGMKTNWTASASVTCTVTTADNREGGECQSIAVAAGFTTGLAAYFATGTIDLSGYQQLSFHLKQTAGTLATANSVTVKLCSDAAGVTAVDTFTIPVALAILNQWTAFTIDKGANCGAAIASIALYIDTDNGAQTFLVDNFIAVKAASDVDALSLRSLIGKGGSETYCAIQSINGKRVMLDSFVNSRPTTAAAVLQRGYSGTSETHAAYRRETIKIGMHTSLGSPTGDCQVQDSGTAGSPITYSGGWDRTAMTSQSGETWWDGQNGAGGVQAGSKSWVAFVNLHLVRFTFAHWMTGNNSFTTYSDCTGNNNTTRGLHVNQSSTVTADFRSLSYNGDNGYATSTAGDLVNLTVDQVDGNHGAGICPSGVGNSFVATLIRNNGTFGIHFKDGTSENVVKDSTTSGNGTSAVQYGGTISGEQTSPGRNFLLRCTLGESTEFISTNSLAGRLWSKDHDNVAGSIVCFAEGAAIYSETTTRHTASGRAYRIAITSTVLNSSFPFSEEWAKVAVAASSLVTVKAWLRRTNTGLTHKLVCKGGQIGGVSADVTASMTAAADTWEELTITFTPNEAGVVSITTETYGGTTYSGYIDDMTISQA